MSIRVVSVIQRWQSFFSFHLVNSSNELSKFNKLQLTGQQWQHIEFSLQFVTQDSFLFFDTIFTCFTVIIAIFIALSTSIYFIEQLTISLDTNSEQ